MKRLWAIFRKEFWEYFRSPIAYCVTLVFLEIMNALVFFMFDFLESETADLRGVFFDWMPWVYLFFIPAVAMRLWAEEKKEGTLETVMTLPASLFDWTLGKFLAAWAFIGFGLLLTFPLVISVAYLGDPDIGLIFCGYLSAFLLAGAYLAFGMFASSLTENQIIAFIITASGGFLFVVLGWPNLAKYFPESIQPIASYLSFSTHQVNMAMGVIDSRNLIYFASFIGFFLFFTIVIQDHRRYDKGILGRSRRAFPAAPVVAILLVVMSLFALNYFSSYRYFRWDWTEDKLHTFSPISLQTITELDKNKKTVDIKAYLSSESDVPPEYRLTRRRVEEFLREYEAHSGGALTLKIIDPVNDKREEEAQKRGIEVKALPDPKLKRFVNTYMGMVIWCKDRYETIPDLTTLGNIEYQITRAIRKVTADRDPVVTVLCKNGLQFYRRGVAKKEIPFYALLEGELRAEYDVRVVAFEREQRQGMLWEKDNSMDIPEETETLIILEPNGIPPEQINQIAALINMGRNVIILFEAKAPYEMQGRTFEIPADPKLDKMLAQWGITFQPKIIEDYKSCVKIPLSGIVKNRPVTEMVDYPLGIKAEKDLINKDNAITAHLKNPLIFIGASVLLADKKRLPSTVEYTELIKTSDATEIRNEEKLRQYSSELDYYLNKEQGPRKSYPLAIYLTGQFPNYRQDENGKALSSSGLSKPAKVLLVACAKIVNDKYLPNNNRQIRIDNIDFILNAVDVMTLGDSQLVELRGKDEKIRKFDKYEEIRKKIRDENKDLDQSELTIKETDEIERIGFWIIFLCIFGDFIIVICLAAGVFGFRWARKRKKITLPPKETGQAK